MRSLRTLPSDLHRLVEDLGVSVALPAVRSELVAGARRTRHADGKIVEQYPRSYARGTGSRVNSGLP